MSTDFEERLRAARDTLPKPDSTVSTEAEQHALAGLPTAIGKPRRLPMPRRRRLAGVAALVAAALLVGGFAGSELASSTRAATPTPVPAFTPTVGWTMVQTSVGPPDVPPPNKPVPVAWAANLPFDAQDLGTTWPNPPLQNLPSDGIVISVAGPSEGPVNQQARIVKPPYRVEDMYFWASADAAAHALNAADSYQGEPAPNVSLYWISAPTGPDRGIGISVWMGRNDPTPAMKAAADQELARLTLPPPTATTPTNTTVPTTTTAP
jgi:hypothetical protein